MTAQLAAKSAVGRLTEGELARFCADGETLRRIARAAGVTHQAVHQAMKSHPDLEALRTESAKRHQRAADFRRYAATRHGARLVAAAGELREHCPELELEWRRTRCAWALRAGDLPVSLRHAPRPLRFGAPGCLYLGYRVRLHRAGHVYLVRIGDGRRFVFVDSPAKTYVWWEAQPPWRSGPRSTRPDCAWRGR